MDPSTTIVSYKALTPPRSGDMYRHRNFGPVKLIKPGGGDSWICRTLTGTHFYLRPSKMKPIPEDSPQ